MIRTWKYSDTRSESFPRLRTVLFKVGLDWHNGTRELSEANFGLPLEKTTVELNKHEHIMQMNATTGTGTMCWGTFKYSAISTLFFWIIDMETLQCRIVECGGRERDKSQKLYNEDRLPLTKTGCHIGGVSGTRGEALYTVGAIYVPLDPGNRKKLQEHERHYQNFLSTNSTCSAKPLAQF
jgi:hypothetical protein